ncbi:Bcr/CflA family multidrug efflux MFS transporter [Pseudomonas sp. 5P_3.1_Bac2]|uniref:Bcr/CflA family multidrug efflux MFS transporter n=1 Tax=Pseudomonas sp. 5P_3.1_Bac2 TaxID=2971617 RepID=UPI0021C681B3|nr:Bcr/CflA family multidrug efflux MFS transporter [Pseudomonas sp. 5P_3.1_Bac2]MCU1719393.1 Bcr/CflA family multidrug efflux MFS transporter [Pseudomonas sp. 5P_3.1_Bac2]
MPLRLLLILGALSAFGPLAVDFYLPSFPALAEAFGTDAERVQLSLAAYFVGLALGQLLYGPLADRFGRRIPLLAGVALFCLASLACAVAPSLEWLIAARFVQALGGCAGMVVSRAVVRDLCDPIHSAKVFSQLMLVMGVAPIMAPGLGGLLLSTLGWPSIFICLTLFSLGCWLAIARWLPESMPKDMAKVPLNQAWVNYRGLFRDGAFMGYALTSGFAMAGMFSYIAGSPFIFIQLYGVAPEHYGLLFGSNALGFILVAQINARLVARFGPDKLLNRVVWLYLSFGVILLLVALARFPVLWPFLLPLFCCIACLGVLLPNASACAMAGQGQHAGSASALLGSVQFAIAASMASLVGLLHDGTARPVALLICLCGVLTVSCNYFTRWAEARQRQAAAA